MDLTAECIVSALQELEKKSRAAEESFIAADEIAHFKKIQSNADAQSFLSNYSFEKLSGAGGSGVVICAKYKPYGTLRALKIPRSHVLTEDIQIKENPEVHALAKLNHQNIMRYYESTEVFEGHHILVTEYIPKCLELGDYISSECSKIQSAPSEHKINEILNTLAILTRQLTDALSYMHDSMDLYHFDVKPGNVLVDTTSKRQPRACLIDLGFARDRTRYTSSQEFDQGFTWRYSHPDLSSSKLARIKQTQKRATIRLKRQDLEPKYDLFALGRSIQECLKIVYDHFSDKASCTYVFDYLHLVACLCLDGKNTSIEFRPDQWHVDDVASSYPPDLFKAHKFKKITEVSHSLDKLLNRYRIEHDVPELDPWYGSTINSSDVTFINLTPRLQRTIIHPMFKRLEAESQLGMLREVFPTATHSRGNHSLGVFGAACRYISALYWDPDNPLCRILFTPPKIRAILVAGLLHDIGQTGFGHDIEELDEESFSHTTFTSRLIELSSSIGDALGESIEKIISDEEPQGWKLNQADILRVLSRKESTPIDHLLNSILDGPIDADKLDYLVRDSVDCRVEYGHGIDVSRFLRSLTTTVTPGDAENPRCRVELAIKAKGKASADAFIIARTQMYQALYWHHTFRAIKGMFLGAASYTIEALTSAQPDAKYPLLPGKSVLSTETIVEAYFEFVFLHALGIDSSLIQKHKRMAAATKKNGHFSMIMQKLSEAPPLVLRGGGMADRTIDFFYRLGPENAQQLLRNLAQRHFYKRVFEIPLSEVRGDKFNQLRNHLSSFRQRASLMRSLEKALYARLTEQLQVASKTQESLQSDKGKTLLDSAWVPGASIVIDAPVRMVDKVPEAPSKVSDYKRKYRHGGRALLELGDSPMWANNAQQLMKESAYLRVFAKPDVHDLMLRYSKLTDDRNIIREVLGV